MPNRDGAPLNKVDPASLHLGREHGVVRDGASVTNRGGSAETCALPSPASSSGAEPVAVRHAGPGHSPARSKADAPDSAPMRLNATGIVGQLHRQTALGNQGIIRGGSGRSSGSDERELDQAVG